MSEHDWVVSVSMVLAILWPLAMLAVAALVGGLPSKKR